MPPQFPLLQVYVLHHDEQFLYQLRKNQHMLVNAGLLQEALRDLFTIQRKLEME